MVNPQKSHQDFYPVVIVDGHSTSDTALRMWGQIQLSKLTNEDETNTLRSTIHKHINIDVSNSSAMHHETKLRSGFLSPKKVPTFFISERVKEVYAEFLGYSKKKKEKPLT